MDIFSLISLRSHCPISVFAAELTDGVFGDHGLFAFQGGAGPVLVFGPNAELVGVSLLEAEHLVLCAADEAAHRLPLAGFGILFLHNVVGNRLTTRVLTERTWMLKLLSKSV